MDLSPRRVLVFRIRSMGPGKGAGKGKARDSAVRQRESTRHLGRIGCYVAACDILLSVSDFWALDLLLIWAVGRCGDSAQLSEDFGSLHVRRVAHAFRAQQIGSPGVAEEAARHGKRVECRHAWGGTDTEGQVSREASRSFAVLTGGSNLSLQMPGESMFQVSRFFVCCRRLHVCPQAPIHGSTRRSSKHLRAKIFIT